MLVTQDPVRTSLATSPSRPDYVAAVAWAPDGVSMLNDGLTAKRLSCCLSWFRGLG